MFKSILSVDLIKCANLASNINGRKSFLLIVTLYCSIHNQDISSKVKVITFVPFLGILEKIV